MKGKLTKEERRHLDDARRDKQVKEHAIHQAQELPLVRSSFRPRKPSWSQRLPPLRLFCPPPMTKSSPWNHRRRVTSSIVPQLLCTLLVSVAYHPFQVRVARAVLLQAFLPRRSVQLPCAPFQHRGPRAIILLKENGSFSPPSL